MMTSPAMEVYYKQQNMLANPEVRKLSVLDEAMTNILARTDLSSRNKVTLYLETLNRYTNVRRNVSSPQPENIPT